MYCQVMGSTEVRTGMTQLKIKPVETKSELNQFVKFQFRLYADEPNWVAPLIWERKRFLNPKINPFFEHARVQYFLAIREGRIVGRISAHIDNNFQEFHKNRWGFFGFFECENDPEAAGALIDSAADWVKERGCDRIVGPCDFTTNDPCGVLIDGFTQPLILTPWNHQYYQSLLEGLGLKKAMDLFMWNVEFKEKDLANPILWKLADRAGDRYGVTVRNMRKSDLENELAIFREIYNVAWKDNWGFVPLTEKEVRWHAKELKPILVPEWTFVAEIEGKPVAAALTLPDYNQVLSRLRGRLLPIGWAKALYLKHKISRIRVFALGVRPEWRHTGVAAKLYADHYEQAEKDDIVGAEMGWTLEVNRDMNKALEAMHGRIVRTLRIYEREL
jgi:GNAT superfamily N-acetyltransferase